MASLISHPAVPLAIGVALGSRVISPRLLLAGVAACLLPDADVIAFHFGVHYGSPLGHRGWTHSLAFALMCGALAAACARGLRTTVPTALLFVSLAAASHGLLDAFTTGGSGVAFFWPLSDERHFLPVQKILVSPIGISRFLSERGVQVLLSELRWVWLPCLILGTALHTLRRPKITLDRST